MIIKIDDSKIKSSADAAVTDTLSLAYLGDAVIELLARDHTFFSYKGSINELHKQTVSLVSANAQSIALGRILPFLSDDETTIYKRGRNVKTHASPKHTDPKIYHRATGLEALFGYLFITGQSDRMNELFNVGFKNDISTEE